MAHQYRQRILVTLRANGEPGGIVWRDVAYSVVEVLARWHLRDRWWATQGRASTGDVPPVALVGPPPATGTTTACSAPKGCSARCIEMRRLARGRWIG